jgi:PAS domain S-box-containing protein
MRLQRDDFGLGDGLRRQRRDAPPWFWSLRDASGNITSSTRYFVAFAAVGVGGLTQWGLARLLGPISPWLTLYPSVLMVALTAGAVPGAVALALTLFLMGHWPTAQAGPPGGGIPADPASLGVFICFSLAFCLVAEQRRRALLRETAGRRQTELLSLTMSSIPEGVIATDAAGRVTFVNQAAAQLLQVAPAVVQGASLQSVFEAATDAKDREPVANLINSILRGASRIDIAASLASPPDSDREAVMELSGAPIRSGDGTMCGAVVTFRDCTQRKRAEQDHQRLLESIEAEKEWFSQVLSSINEEVYFTDTRRRYTFANAAAMREFGHQTVKGIEVEKIVSNLEVLRADGTPRPIEDAPPLRALTGEVIRDEEQITRIPRTGELRHRQVSSAPVRDASGRIIGSVSVVRDITERKRAEAALREADHRKNLFLATLSHELRNPLAPILTAARVLESPEATVEDQKRCGSIISHQVTHMAALLNDLLDVSRFTRGEFTLKMERVRLQEILDSAIETTRPLIDGKQHRLHLELPSTPLLLEVDPVRLTQVVNNLLANAAKYTNAGGDITLGSRLEADGLLIFVRDTGIGLAAENVADIFEIFVQLEPSSARAQGGLGIGLALVKGLVELHGGRVQVLSDGRDRGSTFNVILPRSVVVEELAFQSDAVTPAPAHQEMSRRVLIADDGYQVAEALAILLERRGHEVHIAHEGLEALRLAAEIKPDIAFLDIGMPGLSGYEIATRIRREPWGRHMMLVAVSGWGQDNHKRDAYAAGFDEHFTKPMDPRLLRSIFASMPLPREPRA